jgi:hypothetical protein
MAEKWCALHRFGYFKALIVCSHYGWSSYIVRFREIWRNSRKKWPFLVVTRPFVQDIDILTVCLHPPTIMLPVVHSCYVVHILIMLWWKECVLWKENERQAKRLFLSHQIPIQCIEKMANSSWQGLISSSSPELVAFYGNWNGCSCMWRVWRWQILRTIWRQESFDCAVSRRQLHLADNLSKEIPLRHVSKINTKTNICQMIWRLVIYTKSWDDSMYLDERVGSTQNIPLHVWDCAIT